MRSPLRWMVSLTRSAYVVALLGGFALSMIAETSAYADSAVPTSIVATNLGGGVVSFSGGWSWPGCVAP